MATITLTLSREMKDYLDEQSHQEGFQSIEACALEILKTYRTHQLKKKMVAKMIMSAVLLPKTMLEFLEVHAPKEGFGQASDYLQSLISREIERTQAKKELEEKLKEGFQSPVVRMTEESWRAWENRLFAKYPDLQQDEA